MAQWLITSVTNTEDQKYVGVRGPSDCKDLVAMPYSFRMVCDDATEEDIMCYGVCEEQEFDPLDDFGTANWGCSRIEYFNTVTKEWVLL